MIKKNIINSKNAPSAIGTYSQGISTENLIFTSGQIPINPETNEIVSGKFEEQVNQVLYNLNEVLVAAGSNKDNLVKLTVFITDLTNFDKLNNAFVDFFGDAYPARSVVEVSALPRGAMVEIEGICIK